MCKKRGDSVGNVISAKSRRSVLIILFGKKDNK